MGTDRELLRRTLTRLVAEAPVVAPSIVNFDTDHGYGRVTDERLDEVRRIRLSVESDTVLTALAENGDPRFDRILRRYKEQLDEHVHSQSIHVHRTQLVLQAALQLLDTDDFAAADTSEARAMRLLTAIRVRTEHKGEPVFIAELADMTWLTLEQAQSAWRYLRDHRLIDTFRLDSTARINGRGIDKLDSIARASTGQATPEHPVATRPYTLDRRDLPDLPSEPLAVLCDLWYTSITSDRLVDAPVYREAHRDWVPLLAELERRRCIAREGDYYRLTPLGLLSLRNSGADEVVRLGDRIRVLLADRYRNPFTRSQPVSIEELSSQLNVPINTLSPALFHLSDAISRWCAQFTTDFTAPKAVLYPAERALDTFSVADVARELAGWAASSRTAELVAENVAAGLPATASPASAEIGEPVADRWIKKLKNNRAFAPFVVLGVVIIAVGTVVDNGHRLLGLLPDSTPALKSPTPLPDLPESIDDVLSRDMTLPIDLCLHRNGSERVIECVTHGACRGEDAEGLGFAIDKTSKASAISSCKGSCNAEAARVGARCTTPP